MLNRIVAACWLSLGALVSFNIGLAQAQNAATFPSGGGGTPGGSNTQVQYNNSGAFGGITGVTSNGTGLTITANGALSSPALAANGTWIGSGTGTTTKPYILIEPTGTTSTGWNTNGTALGINVPSTSSASPLDIQHEGVSQFALDGFGKVTAIGKYVVTNAVEIGDSNKYAVNAAASYSIGWSPNTNVQTAPDAMFTRFAAATIQMGGADAAAPVAQALRAQSVIAGTTNTGGTDLTLTASAGTGTGAGGNIIFQVAPAGSTGTAQNALVQGMILDSKGHVRVGSQTAPALTSCGTSPSIVGDDTAATVTMGTSTPTGCVITFNRAYANAPICTVTWRATPLASQSYAISTTAITLTQTATSSNVIDYICRAQNGG